jgi:hypothetical protein
MKGNREGMIDMGFDIEGIKPVGKKGVYFRNNVWYWRRLADFCLDHVIMPPNEKKYWHSNDGQKVSERTALKIAKFLKSSLKEKEKYAKWIRDSRNNCPTDSGKCLYPFTWENIKEFAIFCENSGGFRIW